MMQKIGFGGGCHWCTEAVFESLAGVEKVLQGWISSSAAGAASFSEAVVVHFDPETIPLEVLTEIHLLTHRSTANHAMRSKYRSAIYTFDDAQRAEAEKILRAKAALFEKPIVTVVLPFKAFKLNDEKFLHYYRQDPQRPFCRSYIEPKLQLILSRYGQYAGAGRRT